MSALTLTSILLAAAGSLTIAWSQFVTRRRRRLLDAGRDWAKKLDKTALDQDFVGRLRDRLDRRLEIQAWIGGALLMLSAGLAIFEFAASR